MNNYLKIALVVIGLVMLFFIVRLTSCGSGDMTTIRANNIALKRVTDSLEGIIKLSDARIAELSFSADSQAEQTHLWAMRAVEMRKVADSIGMVRRTVIVRAASPDASDFAMLVESQGVAVPANIVGDTIKRGVMGRTISVATYLIEQGTTMRREIPALRAVIDANDSSMRSMRSELMFKDGIIYEDQNKFASLNAVVENTTAINKQNLIAINGIRRKKNGAIIGGTISGLVVGALIGALTYSAVIR